MKPRLLLRVLLFALGVYLLWPLIFPYMSTDDIGTARDSEAFREQDISQTIGIPVTCANERTGQPYSPSIIGEPSGSDPNLHELNMWVEDFRVSGRVTVLELAAASWGRPAYLEASEGAYFTNYRGEKYALEHDWGSYDLANATRKMKTCLPHEICRVRLQFARLPVQTPFLYFHHPQFDDIKLTLDWSGFNGNH